MRILTRALAGFAAAGAAVFPLAGASAATAAYGAAAKVYVSPHGWAHASDRSCGSARYRSINRAIAAVRAGGTVVVCPGTYRTQAVITKPLSLLGHGATIDARGQKPLAKKLPGGSGVVVYATRNVQVSGFRVVNAGFDAILVARSRHILVSRNVLMHNGSTGVDFNGTSDSLATHNISEHNQSGGFYIADDEGPTWHDAVTWNIARFNRGGCGVIIAGHSTAGVWDNLVQHNVIEFNGLSKASPGAGVVIASEVPKERVSGNAVLDNIIRGNGLAGITIHAHMANQNLNDNLIAGNVIGTNNLRGDPIGLAPPVTAVPDRHATGILVGSSSVIRVFIRGNYIHDNWFGIYLNGRIHAHITGNRFHRVRIPVKVA
jgi:nitrous oxidase accessory protein NosD